MKKFTLLLILNLSFIIYNSPTVKAQYVTIPDANFVTWLTQNYPSCMSGNQMDTTCSGIVNEDTVVLNSLNIMSLIGIEYFDSLKYLYCAYNQLTVLPSLPNSLQILFCFDNQLSNITSLPNSLQYIDCCQNQLNNLPTLPNSLQVLYCFNNQLINLPALPNSLLDLNCSGNQLSSLPALPNLLQTLRCYDNQLSSLSALPNSLQALFCSNNQLSSLPTLPNSLQVLNCNFNQLINLPVLPSMLHQLECYSNQLTTLPDLPPLYLQYLDCGLNQLSSLPALPITLQTIYCYYNQLSSLPVLPLALQTLYCQFNQLISIPQVPEQMQVFVVSNNNISCLVNLPQANTALISNNPLTCVPNQTNYSLGLPLCMENDPINNPNNCQSVANIVGSVYTDLNSNCTYNITDWNTQNIPVKLYDTQNNFLALSYTINGVYSFAALQPDSFKVKINDVLLPLDIACGLANNQTVHLDSANQTIANINFPVVCDTANDIYVHSVTRQGWVHPGQVHTVNTNLANDLIWYNLNCDSTNYSGTVTINIAGPITYVAPTIGALTPTISGNTFTYSIANFDSITPTSFGLKLLTDTTAQAGNQICVHVSIATTPLDADTSNNEYDFCYNVVNSYDPNLKEVYPTDVLPGYNDWFTYTIHFQNTGTAPAFNIRLHDTLDTQLDLNTFEFLGASHTASTSLNGRNLSVRFNNIMLPDSTSNDDGSMGYYQYRVKPLPNIINGSNIKNTAYIYFDYNPAIVTNTTENHFDMTVGNIVIARKNDEAISIYPNPVKDKLYFKNLPKNSTIIIYNILGEVCLIHHSSSSATSGEVGGASLPKGVYFAKVNGQKVVKLVKE